jgi:hypothetical protein
MMHAQKSPCARKFYYSNKRLRAKVLRRFYG